MIRAGRPRSPCLKISKGNRFSVPHWVQNDSRVLLLSYAVGTRGSLSGGQVAGREADHSLPFIAETNNAWSYTSTLSYIFIAAVNIGNIVLEPLSKWSHSFGIPDHIFPPPAPMRVTFPANLILLKLVILYLARNTICEPHYGIRSYSKPGI